MESDETVESGRLFSPCLCSGSSGHIHEACLSQWRRSNAAAYFRCGVCKYAYRTSRQYYASLITHPWTISITTVVVVVSSIALVAYFLKFLCYVALGASASRSAFALSGKLIMWAAMIIGITSFIVGFLTSDAPGDTLEGLFRLIVDLAWEDGTVQYIGPGLSFAGIIFFIIRVYSGVRAVARKWMEKLGDRVLGV
jgi:E3 ubiquitin-protein ligase DOA10